MILTGGRGGVRVGTTAVAVLTLTVGLAWIAPSPSLAGPLPSAEAHRPVPVTIGTVPPVPGFPMSLDGATRSTGPDGKVAFIAPGVGDQLAGRVGLLQGTVTVDGRQVRAKATSFYPSRTAPVVSVDLSYLVQFRLSGRDGAPVDPAGLGDIVVRSDTGQVIGVPADRPVWLLGSHVERVGADLRVRAVNWRVQRVDYSGTDVVNGSQQQFRPADNGVVGVELLFYRVRVHTRDAIFGFSHAGLLKLVYPNGSSHLFSLTAQGDATLPALPRGDYSATVLGDGPRVPEHLTVSRDQDVQLQTYSWWDLGTVLGAVLAVAGGLAWIGRARRRRAARGTSLGQPEAETVPLQPRGAGLGPAGTGLVRDSGP